MKTIVLSLTLLVVCVFNTFGQIKVMSFQEAEKQGVIYQQLDKMYKSAVHSNTDLAVFKTPSEQTALQQAYTQFLQNLGSFLKTNNFNWEGPTRCFNRIYLNNDGSVDYFLYHFQKDQIAPSKEKEFSKLLVLFIRENKFPITSNEKFAQCSPVVYK